MDKDTPIPSAETAAAISTTSSSSSSKATGSASASPSPSPPPTDAAAAAATSSSSSSSHSVPRYHRPPKGETDYASAMPDEMLRRCLLFVNIDDGVRVLPFLSHPNHPPTQPNPTQLNPTPPTHPPALLPQVAASMSSQRWATLFNERVCQAHCERIYLDQGKSKRLNPARFNNSWKKMLTTRPRVRTNGLFYLRSSYIKKPTKVGKKAGG